jgi:hypothetical protein
MPTTVGSVPVGTQTTATGDTISVSYLRENPLVLAGRLGEVMELEYFVDLILPNVGTPKSGVIVYREADPTRMTLNRSAEELAPDAEVPLAGIVEGDLKYAIAKTDGLGMVITDDEADENQLFVVEDKELALANSMSDRFNSRGVTVIKAAITANSRTFDVGAGDWSALVTDGANPDPLSLWPHAQIAQIRAQQTVDRIPWRFNGMLAHPMEIWRLSTIYLKNAGVGGEAPVPSAAVLNALAGKLGLDLIVEDNTGGIERGKPILFSRGHVGGTGWQKPINVEKIPERGRRRTRFDAVGKAVYFVNNPYGLLQLEGTADQDLA